MKKFLVIAVAVIFSAGTQAQVSAPQATDNNSTTAAEAEEVLVSEEDGVRGNILVCKAHVFARNLNSYLLRVTSEALQAALPQQLEAIEKQFTGEAREIEEQLKENNLGGLKALTAAQAKLTEEIATATGDDKRQKELALAEATAAIQKIEEARPILEEKLKTGFYKRESFKAQMKARSIASESEQLYMDYNKQRQEYITACNEKLLSQKKDGEAAQSIAFVETITADFIRNSVPHTLDNISLLVQLIDEFEFSANVDKENKSMQGLQLFTMNQNIEKSKSKYGLQGYARTWENAINYLLIDVLYNNKMEVLDKMTMATPSGAITFPDSPLLIASIIYELTNVFLAPKDETKDETAEIIPLVTIGDEPEDETAGVIPIIIGDEPESAAVTSQL